VVDVQTLFCELNACNRAHKLGFQVPDLEGGCIDPHATFQWNRVPHFPVDRERSKTIRSVEALGKMNKPSNMALPFPQSFTSNVKTGNHNRMKEKGHSGKPKCGELSRKLRRITRTVTVLI